MSTKSSLAYADEVHFYHELMDPTDGFYLELRGADVSFSAHPGCVTVRIPPHVWHAIREVPVTLDLAEKTDEELLALVESKVDERILEYEKAEGNGRLRAFLNFAGSGVYGPANMPREKQIEHGLEDYTKEREKQREILRRAGEIKRVNREDFGSDESE